MAPRSTRLVPLLLLLAACGSSATSSVGAQSPSPLPTVTTVTTPEPTGPASTPPPDVPTVGPVAPSRQAPAHSPSPGRRPPAGTVTSSPVSPGPPGPPATGPACSAGQLAMAVTAVASGSDASFTATLTNTGRSSCTVTEGASTPDFTVTDGSGATVWTRACDGSVSAHTGPTPCPMYARIEPLAPGASQRWTQDWDGTRDGDPVKPEQPGPYVVHAAAGAAGTAAFTLG